MNRIARMLTLGVVGLVLAACAGAPAGVPWTPEPPEDEVVGTGLVLDDGGGAQLCLGPARESFPPQCDGIALTDWEWDGVEGSESSGDLRWGTYAVQGVYDGRSIRVTAPPVMLALYDPAPLPAPPAAPGAGEDATLEAIADDLPDWLGAAYLSAAEEDRRLLVDVVWDDGTWQRQADEEYGPDVVVIRSALQVVGEERPVSSS